MKENKTLLYAVIGLFISEGLFFSDNYFSERIGSVFIMPLFVAVVLITLRTLEKGKDPRSLFVLVGSLGFSLIKLVTSVIISTNTLIYMVGDTLWIIGAIASAYVCLLLDPSMVIWAFFHLFPSMKKNPLLLSAYLERDLQFDYEKEYLRKTISILLLLNPKVYANELEKLGSLVVKKLKDSEWVSTEAMALLLIGITNYRMIQNCGLEETATFLKKINPKKDEKEDEYLLRMGNAGYACVLSYMTYKLLVELETCDANRLSEIEGLIPVIQKYDGETALALRKACIQYVTK